MLQSWSSNPNLKMGPRHIQSRLSQSKVSMSAVFFTFSRYFRLANASECSAALQFWAQHLSLWFSPVCTWDINLRVLILKCFDRQSTIPHVKFFYGLYSWVQFRVGPFSSPATLWALSPSECESRVYSLRAKTATACAFKLITVEWVTIVIFIWLCLLST